MTCSATDRAVVNSSSTFLVDVPCENALAFIALPSLSSHGLLVPLLERLPPSGPRLEIVYYPRPMVHSVNVTISC